MKIHKGATATFTLEEWRTIRFALNTIGEINLGAMVQGMISQVEEPDDGKSTRELAAELEQATRIRKRIFRAIMHPSGLVWAPVPVLEFVRANVIRSMNRLERSFYRNGFDTCVLSFPQKH